MHKKKAVVKEEKVEPPTGLTITEMKNEPEYCAPSFDIKETIMPETWLNIPMCIVKAF